MQDHDIELEDPALAAVRHLLNQLDTDPPDVLIFGESTQLFVGPNEDDQRSLADVLIEDLQPRSSFLVAGPGFGAELHHQFIRLAATRSARPVVVTSLYVRGTLPAFRNHPIYGFRRQLEWLERTSGDEPAAVRAPYVPPTDDQWAAYEAESYPTFVARRTVAEFMAELRPPRNPWSAEHMRWLYEFHLGGIPDPAAVQAFTDYGQALRGAGYRVVAMMNPVDVADAVEFLGPDVLDWYRRNAAMVREAFVAGYGSDVRILETGECWRPADFIEPAVEHLAAPARVRLAAIIAEAVAAISA